MFIGFILVILGTLLLLEEMHLINWSFWEYFWPIVIIAVGFRMIIGAKKRRRD